jgi:hypothetical protein
LVGEALLRSLELYHQGGDDTRTCKKPGAFEQQVLRLREQLASYDA